MPKGRTIGSAVTLFFLAMIGLSTSTGCSMNEGCKSDCQAAAEPCEPKPCDEPKPCEEPKPCKPCKTCSGECCHPQADIEALHAVNKPCGTDLAIGYQVDTKHTCDDFDLLVRVEFCGKTVFERLLHLGRPYRTDCDGDRHFHGSTFGKLPEIICANRDKLHITGWVIPHSASGDTSAAIDRERERVHSCEDGLCGARVPGSWPEAKAH